MMKKNFLIAVSILMGILFSIIIFIIFEIHMVVTEHDNLIYKGISINEIDVSLLNKERAERKITENSIKLNENRNILIYADEKEYKISFKELKVEENIDQIVDVAVNYGKNDKIIDKYKYVKEGLERNFKTTITFDEEAFSALLKVLCKEQNMSPVNAVIEHDWSGFKVTPHQSGRTIDEAALRGDIRESIEENRDGEDIIINLTFKKSEPAIYEEDLKAINTLVSSYSTSFANSSSGRTRNIEVASSYINNKVIMPGEEFSFNKVVGVTTSGKGYSYAKVIKNGGYVDEIGGGICQVSSTLYNVVLKTSLAITERRNHSKVINYVPRGQDAMIAYGVSDFKFVNNFKYPILIESVINNNMLTFNIYSNKDSFNYLYEIKNEIAKEVKPKKETIYDYGLSKGTVIVEQEGKNGYVINTYRVRYEEGKIKEKILVSESVYAGKNTIVRIGKD